ncbi:hypothetical protein LUZ60_004740 [Juncus effusus]|nr:hypothetical protein LUZ60_004740 [Juncus effusus]
MALGFWQRKRSRPASMGWPVHLFLSLAVLSCLAILLYPQMIREEALLRAKKTVVGHNLKPIPWQGFKQDRDKPTTFSLFHCNYLSSCNHFFKLNPSPNTNHNPNAKNKCPSFFSSIHSDLAPWQEKCISLALIEASAPHHAAFRVVISNGRLYVDLFYACVQTRMLFTVWGLVQLLKRYPGMVPDVDILFDCSDRPTIERKRYDIPKGSIPPPVFRYCTTNQHFDIPFPDWSFWGWSEVNLMPWDEEFESIKIHSQSVKWKDKVNTAFWRGNPDVGSPARKNLLSCNDSKVWRAEIFRQDWQEEARTGYKNSKPSSQCNNRYKIYAEGWAWSVSLKYILSCGSPTFIVDTQYQDFFTRGLVPKKNFLPVNFTDLCQSIKTTVEWGDVNPSEAEAIGKRGQELMQDIKMDYVYDYMYHLLVEYSKLLDFKPTPPLTAHEVCDSALLCVASERERQFLERASASPSMKHPCVLTPNNATN